MNGSLFESKLKRIGYMGECAYVYRFYNANDVLLYVGSTSSLRKRIHEHYRDNPWFRWVARGEWEHCETRAKASEIEMEAIREERPKYNKLGQLDGPTYDSLGRLKERLQARLW